MTIPTIREVLVALEHASSAVPGFECVIAPLPPHVQAAQSAQQIYLDPDQPVDVACEHLVAAVAELVTEVREKRRHLRLLPRPDEDEPVARSDGIA